MSSTPQVDLRLAHLSNVLTISPLRLLVQLPYSTSASYSSTLNYTTKNFRLFVARLQRAFSAPAMVRRP